MMRYFLPAATIFVPNRMSAELLQEIKKSFRLQFGRMNPAAWAASMAVVVFSITEYLRRRFGGDGRGPKTSCRPLRSVFKHGGHQTKFSNTAPAWARTAGHATE